eukprot:62662-Chlamydomonas_euryale.AAC.2
MRARADACMDACANLHAWALACSMAGVHTDPSCALTHHVHTSLMQPTRWLLSGWCVVRPAPVPCTHNEGVRAASANAAACPT